MSEQRRSWTAKQKLEIVLAGLKGDRSIRDDCREHRIAETLYYGWRDKLFEGSLTALSVAATPAAPPLTCFGGGF